MLRVSMGALERCAPDKEKSKVICPSIWIHYVLDGRGYYNGHPLTAGQAFIIYKNDICEYFPDKKDPWTYVWIRLEGQDEENLLQRCGIPSASCAFSFDYAEKLTDIALALFGRVTTPVTNVLLGEATAKMILSLHLKREVEQQCAWDEAWVIKAKAYISANYHRALKVEQIAEALHIDRQYLRNLFVKYTGASTKAYLNTYRMTRAVELLQFADTEIHIVARSVGYTDPLSFSKAFKKYYGVSPSEYAASLRAKD